MIIGALALVIGAGSVVYAGISAAEVLATGKGSLIPAVYFAITGIGCIVGGLWYTPP